MRCTPESATREPEPSGRGRSASVMTSMTSDGDDAFRSRSREDAFPATRASWPSKNTCTSGFSAGVTSRKIRRTGSAGLGEKAIPSGERPIITRGLPRFGQRAWGIATPTPRSVDTSSSRASARSAILAPGGNRSPGIAAASSAMACCGVRAASSSTTPPARTASRREGFESRGYSSSIRPTTCSRMSSIVIRPTGLPRVLDHADRRPFLLELHQRRLDVVVGPHRAERADQPRPVRVGRTPRRSGPWPGGSRPAARSPARPRASARSAARRPAGDLLAAGRAGQPMDPRPGDHDAPHGCERRFDTFSRMSWSRRSRTFRLDRLAVRRRCRPGPAAPGRRRPRPPRTPRPSRRPAPAPPARAGSAPARRMRQPGVQVPRRGDDGGAVRRVRQVSTRCEARRTPACSRMASRDASPKIGGLPLPLQLGDRVHVHVDHDRRQPRVAQQPVHRAAHRAEADDHREALPRRDVPADLLRRVRVGLATPPLGAAVEQRPQPRTAAQPGLDRVQRAEQERVERDREDRRGDQHVVPGVGHQAVLAGQLGQDERELADLRQAQGHGQRGADRVARAPRR